MALKAIYESQYTKRGSGHKIMVYTVTGPTAELEAYTNVQENRSGKLAGTWPKSTKGLPLFYLNATLELRNGNIPEVQMDLAFSMDNSRVFIDRSRQEMAEYAEIKKHTATAVATIRAEMLLGLRGPAQSGTPTTRTAPATPTTTGSEKPDLTEEIMAGVGLGGNGTGDLGGPNEDNGGIEA